MTASLVSYLGNRKWFYASLAQLVEHFTRNEGVVRSSRMRSFFIWVCPGRLWQGYPIILMFCRGVAQFG